MSFLHLSDLPWWGWLLCTLVAVSVASIGKITVDAKRSVNKPFPLSFLMFVIGAWAALILGIITIVRLAKWAWGL
jgi:hypothetical protein